MAAAPAAPPRSATARIVSSAASSCAWTPTIGASSFVRLGPAGLHGAARGAVSICATTDAERAAASICTRRHDERDGGEGRSEGAVSARADTRRGGGEGEGGLRARTFAAASDGDCALASVSAPYGTYRDGGDHVVSRVASW